MFSSITSARSARIVAAGLAATALSPAAAIAMPIGDDGPVGGTAPAAQDLRAPDQVDGGFAGKQDLRAPDAIDRGPQGAARFAPAPKPADDGGGVDTEVWVVLAGSGLAAAAALGMAARFRVRSRVATP